MDKTYNAYKIVFADGHTTYRSFWSQANAAAGTYFNDTGKEAKVYGFVGDKLHLIKTWRKAPRT